MKSAFAYVLIIGAACAGLARAEAGQEAEGICPPVASVSSSATSSGADCQARREVFRVAMHDCLVRRAADAEALAPGKAAGSSHASRARYLLCAAELKGSAELVLP
jgi:hypothetical protein